MGNQIDNRYFKDHKNKGMGKVANERRSDVGTSLVQFGTFNSSKMNNSTNQNQCKQMPYLV